MNNYNLAGLRQRVLVDKLDDDEFDPNVVDRFINDTQRYIFNRFALPFQEKIFSGTIPAGSTMFKLPDDLAQLQSQSVGGVPNFNNRKTDFRSFFQSYPDVSNAPAAAPQRWCLYGGNVLLSAPTDKEYTMTLFYIQKPNKLLSDTDVPQLPEEFEEALVLGAYRRIQTRNEDNDLAADTEREFQDQLNLLVDRYGFREADGPIIMKNRQIRPVRRV